MIELYYAEQVLWTRDGNLLPAVMPFRFRLTADLPQCIHTGHGGLTYVITAHIVRENGAPLTISSLVHPRRYLAPDHADLQAYTNTGAAAPQPQRPGEAAYSVTPIRAQMEGPVDVYYSLHRSVVEQHEPIHVDVHIPAPPNALVADKGLQLRRVVATLSRVVEVHPEGRLYTDDELLRELRRRDAVSASPTVGGARDAPHLDMTPVAVTGKSCRFHSRRAVHLCLTLHPAATVRDAPLAGAMADPGAPAHPRTAAPCESISQDTVVHRVRFVLTLTVALRSDSGEQPDMVARCMVRVLPTLARDAEHARRTPASPPPSQAAGKAPLSPSDEFAPYFDDAEEYDGYDDAAPSASSDPWDWYSSPAVSAQHEDGWPPTEVMMDAAPLPLDDAPPPPPPPIGAELDEAAPAFDEAAPAFDEAVGGPHLPSYGALSDLPPRVALVAPLPSDSVPPPRFDDTPRLSMAWHAAPQYATVVPRPCAAADLLSAPTPDDEPEGVMPPSYAASASAASAPPPADARVGDVEPPSYTAQDVPRGGPSHAQAPAAPVMPPQYSS